MNHYTFQAAFLFCVFLGGGIWLLSPWQEYRKAQIELKRNQHYLQQSIIAKDQIQDEIARLKADPKMIEKIAREKFGWCYPDEEVYEFSKTK